MKAKELRIGNYVNTENGIKKVSTISVDGWSFHQESTPISINEAFLLRLGFYYSDDDNEFLRLDLMHKISLYADFSDNFSTVVLNLKENRIELKYIHELQNLHFALTGHELEFKPLY